MIIEPLFLRCSSAEESFALIPSNHLGRGGAAAKRSAQQLDVAAEGGLCQAERISLRAPGRRLPGRVPGRSPPRVIQHEHERSDIGCLMPGRQNQLSATAVASEMPRPEPSAKASARAKQGAGNPRKGCAMKGGRGRGPRGGGAPGAAARYTAHAHTHARGTFLGPHTQQSCHAALREGWGEGGRAMHLEEAGGKLTTPHMTISSRTNPPTAPMRPVRSGAG